MSSPQDTPLPKKHPAASAVSSNVIAWQQEQAAMGSAYGQFKMGVRYLKGDGVPIDLQKARTLLSASAAQGNQDASNELARLSAQNNSASNP